MGAEETRRGSGGGGGPRVIWFRVYGTRVGTGLATLLVYWGTRRRRLLAGGGGGVGCRCSGGGSAGAVVGDAAKANAMGRRLHGVG